jgi:hypothetical protein
VTIRIWGTSGASSVEINNSTIDAGVPGLQDAGAYGLVLEPSIVVPADALLENSILLEEIEAFNGAGGTVTCQYTNFVGFVDSTGNYTDECPSPSAPDSTNTDYTPQQMFVGPDPSFPMNFDWSLRRSSPAVDGGLPGPVPDGFSTTDFYEDPRIQVGHAENCDTGIRDLGAIELSAVDCDATLSVSTTGTGSGSVTGPGINCGAGATDCSRTATVNSTVKLTATPSPGSRFDGFTGAGCSSSPCTVAIDGSKSVQARFTNTTPEQRTLRVQRTGDGRGTITGPGIDCGGEGHTDCVQSYPRGEAVALTAAAGKKSLFEGFAGSGCSTSPCRVTMTSSRSVVGRFTAAEGPTTTFSKQPRRATRKPVFKLRSSEPGSTFECKVDREAWEECGRKVKLRGLDAGRHKLKARATDGRGITGPAAKATFRVKRKR